MSVTSVVRLGPLAVVVACAGNPAPAGFLPSTTNAVHDVYGGWIEVQVPVGRGDSTVQGELIAVRADSVWILPDSGPVAALATSGIKKGRLARYRSDAGSVAGFSTLGTVSTLSNGAFLIFTAPAWIITGIVGSSSESRAALRGVPPVGWADLAAYARFPQGLPPGVDLAEIRPKPTGEQPAVPKP